MSGANGIQLVKVLFKYEVLKTQIILLSGVHVAAHLL